MSKIGNGTRVPANMSERSLSGTSDDGGIRLSIDLVASTRRHLAFLRIFANSNYLHDHPTLLQAIRRYDELWMPMISDLTSGSTPQMLLPPLDIQWIWYCHTLNPVGYRRYCEKRFSKLLGKPAIFDDENEEYAMNRCRDIWIVRYPSEPFELESDSVADTVTNEDLLAEVTKQRSLCLKFSEPYMSETIYLIAARQRYTRFLNLLQTYGDEYPRLLPTPDILLMWLTHQSYPTTYARDFTEIEGDSVKMTGVWDSTKKEEEEEEGVEATKKMWERTFDQPYEKAGATLDGITKVPPVNWDFLNTDVNKKYKSMEARFLLEVCVFLRSKWEIRKEQEETKRDFLRLRTIRCHRELKIDKPIIDIPSESWQMVWHLYCEFNSRGIIVEQRRRDGGCFQKSSLRNSRVFLWNDLVRAPCLSLGREVCGENVRAVASITPPVQGPYLLKCVPDRVTDDSGAMISDVILRMNRYRPQEGRWLSRTVLDHAGRQCFIVRIRVGEGFWRRGGETPAAVRREDRIIEIREGSWSYIAGSIGTAPEKVVGTATPKPEDTGEKKSSWLLSTGDELTIQLESSSTFSGLNFHLKNQNLNESPVRLLRGRKLHYQVRRVASDSKDDDNREEEEEEEEENFVTIVRYTHEYPKGKATALLNWRLLVVEFLPDEDAVFVLLLCVSILRSMSEMRREDMGNLLVRRRLKEAKHGSRDWGSVILHPSSSCSSSSSSSSNIPPSKFSSPHLQPWHWNAKGVMEIAESTSHNMRQPAFNYSPAEGGDNLYKRGIKS